MSVTLQKACAPSLLNSDSLPYSAALLRHSVSSTVSLRLEMHRKQNVSSSSRFVLIQPEVDKNVSNGYHNKVMLNEIS